MDIKVGDILEGEIIDFTHEGNGVLKVDNMAIFVNGGVIGDKVRVKVDKNKKNYVIARLIKTLKPSKDRVDLDFQIEESRGSIPLIEYDYKKQLEWKKDKINSDLKKFAGLTNVKIHDVVGMDEPYRYRNHVQIPIGENYEKTAIGYYRIGSNKIQDMNKSILHPEIGDKIIGILRKWMEKYNIKAYDKRSKKGIMRHLGMRFNNQGQVMVILVTGSDNIPCIKELVDLLKDEKIISIYQNINKLNSSITYGNRYKKISGSDYILDNIGQLEFKISPNSFFQVNRVQAEVLYKRAIEYLDLDKEDIVIDLYSGIGTLSLYIGQKAKKVIGIEMVKKAIEDANINAELNNIKNVEYILGKAEDVFPEMMKEGVKANKLILDPPRKGVEREVLESIVDLDPVKVVYVSCNPSTMARDVKYLAENGYRLEEVQPVDMFCHTAHVEAVTLLTKSETICK